MGIKDVECWINHSYMSVSVNFIKIGLLVAYQFHHALQILVLVISRYSQMWMYTEINTTGISGSTAWICRGTVPSSSAERIST